MDQDTIIADIERRAFDAGVSIRQLCLRANLDPTTFSRWKRSARNPKPVGATLQSIGRLHAALAYFEAQPGARGRKAAA